MPSPFCNKYCGSLEAMAMPTRSAVMALDTLKCSIFSPNLKALHIVNNLNASAMFPLLECFFRYQLSSSIMTLSLLLAHSERLTPFAKPNSY
ncbi:hypothetical protein JHK87_052575 [Glycine soja]|nr:hypothetical protein JHK87_052575 [Glycine soja]